MKDELKHIDEFYKANLENYDEQAKKQVWNNLKWTLFWLRYKWIIGISSVVIFLGLASVILMGTSNNLKITTNTTHENKTEKIEIIHVKTKIDKLHKETYPDNIKQENTDADNTLINNSNIQTQDLKPITTEYKDNQIEISDNENSVNNSILDYNMILNRVESRWVHVNISGEPDSTIFGYNQCTDLVPEMQKNHRFAANIYAGPAFSLSEISGYNSEYLAVRNSNESNKYGWSLGVDLKLHINNWIITSGLNYSVYNQSRSYKHKYQEYSEKDSYYQYDTTWVWFFDPPNYGVPIVVGVDSNWVDVYKNVTVDNSGTNQLKYFEIPLLVGYQVNANLISIEVNTGISTGFLLYSNVKVPQFTNTNEIISASEMNHIMFNFVVNASVYYHINSTTSIFVSPYYKQNLKSIFNNDYPVKQTFNTYGLNLGISFNF